MSELVHDLRYALRALWKNPGFSAVAVLTLALGIGANTAIFSVVNGVLLRPLPYDQPDRLVRIFETAPGDPDQLRSVAHPTLDDWNLGLRSFDGIALYGPSFLDAAGQGRPERLKGATVSAAFFSVLRATPALGRAFTEEELRPGGPRAVVLSDALWRRRFGASAGVLGQRLTLDRQAFTIVGVMPRGFRYPVDAEFWASTAIDAEYHHRAARHLSAIGRLKPGITLTAATAELLDAEHRLAERFPETYAGFGVRLFPLRDWIVGDVRSGLVVLLAGVGVVLLIACANVTNLSLARALGRQREIAVRAALGARGSRIARQLVAESLLLSLTGGLIGILGAWWTVDAARALASSQVPRVTDIRLDVTVMAFTAAIAIATGVVVGLLPALQVATPDLARQLKEGGRSATSGGQHGRLRGALVVGQTVMALVLLTSAGLLVRSLGRLAAVDPGVRTQGVLTFGVGLPSAKADDPPYVVAFYRQLRERLEAVPGVVDAAFASRLPLSGDDHSASFRLVGQLPEPGRERSAQDRSVTPGYFRTLGIPVRGREFTDADGPGQPPVVMINEAFAHRFFPGQDPIGKAFVPARAGGATRVIVGVAGDARQFGLDTPPHPEFYLPHAQDPWPWVKVVVRAAVDPRSLRRALERAVWSLDPDMPVTDVRTLDELRSASVAGRRFSSTVLAAFAGLALLLAAMGTYSAMAFVASERRQEVGVRLALGARPADVVRLVVRGGLRLVGVGLALGLPASLAAGRGLRGLLFDVSPADPWTLAGVTLVLAAAALLASYLPARRATLVDPVEALRHE